MSAPAVHRVRRLSWQVRAATPTQAFALRSRLQAQTDTLPALLDGVLEEVCGAHVPETVVWKIPRLSLQLDLDGADLPDVELRPRLEAALRQALAAALRTMPEGLASGNAAVPAVSHATAAVDADTAAPPWRPASSEAHAAFAHYLWHGSLPWPQQTLPPEQQLALLRGVALAQFNDLVAGAHGADALHRLQALLPGPRAGREGALARWLALLPSSQARGWVEAVLRRGSGNGAAGRSLDTTGAQVQALASALLRTADAASPELAGPHEAAERDLGRGHAAALAAPDIAEPSAASAPGSGPSPGQPPAWHASTEQSAAPLADMPAERETAASQLVPLAGLVLLHPYLPRLLQGCGLVDERARRIDDAVLPRACALLHALAVGSAPAHEFTLPLVKLLLGRDPDAPLARALPAIEADDVAEVDALLSAVRTHWPALAGTGDEGLRVSFLQRRGLLSRANGAWQLRMSREPFDLLLGLLPWGIGFVRTPWMPAPLTVEWPGT